MNHNPGWTSIEQKVSLWAVLNPPTRCAKGSCRPVSVKLPFVDTDCELISGVLEVEFWFFYMLTTCSTTEPHSLVVKFVLPNEKVDGCTQMQTLRDKNSINYDTKYFTC